MTMTPVETGEEFGDRTAVLKGLKASDRIATDHLQLLRQDRRVGIRRDGEPARQAANEPGASVP
ncbi:hypothetical protein LRS73_18880 [Methylobacterium currus]|uniref:hypothetical protein n=1 Tax=Methylobacterium currus TaxID=2051553 RepID=UPI001E6120A9|nr:hypothetical protein [Methylobacterium currus]UHC14603.1 hypothetical protein LRS73_18880 [Methylobacterium currus]